LPHCFVHAENFTIHTVACREFTRLTPKVKDIVFVATFKIMFRPLVDKIPGFGESNMWSK
jgi:hypothetical protein